MANLRKFIEILSIADVLTVVKFRAQETGLKLSTILEKSGVTADEWAHVCELAADPRIGQLRDVCRALDVELAAIQSSGHAPWRDPANPLKHAPREPGLYDRHLAA
jgi:hypothetical protein